MLSGDHRGPGGSNVRKDGGWPHGVSVPGCVGDAGSSDALGASVQSCGKTV